MCNAEQGYRTRSQNPPCSMLMQSRCSQCERVCRKIIMLVVERVPQQDVVLDGRQPVRGARTPKMVVSQLLSTSRPSFLPSIHPSKVFSPSIMPKSQIHRNTIPPKKAPHLRLNSTWQIRTVRQITRLNLPASAVSLPLHSFQLSFDIPLGLHTASPVWRSSLLPEAFVDGIRQVRTTRTPTLPTLAPIARRSSGNIPTLSLIIIIIIKRTL